MVVNHQLETILVSTVLYNQTAIATILKFVPCMLRVQKKNIKF